MPEHRFRLCVVSVVVLLAGCKPGSGPGLPNMRDAGPRAMPGLILRLERSRLLEARAVIRQIRDGARDLASQRAAAHREGIPLAPRELQPPALPAALNAAPVYTRLTRLLKEKPMDPAADEIASKLGLRYAHSAAEIDAVRSMLSERRDVMDLVHEATRRPRCAFQRDWSLGPGVRFAEFASIREAARLLRAESYLMACEGHYREAAANLAGGFCIAQHGASDPIIISFLVGIACDAITLAGMEDILCLAGPRADVAGQVRATIAARRPRFSFRRALDGEVVMALATLKLCRQEGPSLIETPDFSGADPESQQDSRAGLSSEAQPKLTPQEQRVWKMLVDAGEAEYLQRMRPVFAAVKRPYRVHRSVLERIDATEYSPSEPANLFLAILMPVFLAADTKEVQVSAREEVVMAGAVLLAYKARHGAFPERLGQGQPQPPLDPFSGKPLRYRREGAGFVVYSVGPSGNFDGGRPGAPRDPAQAYFRYPAPPPQPPAQS